MPELPEVEVVRAGLERHVLGARIVGVEILHPRPVRRHLAGASAFADELHGRVLTGARRRGKYLWLPLDSGDALMAHLGMSGQMLVQPPSSPDERHLRVRISLLVEPGERQRAGVETNTVESEADRPRTAQSFLIPKSDIAAQGYDLSLNRYKEIEHEEVEHRAPLDIIADIEALDEEIEKGLADLKGMLS
jgi:hypothetical protein